MKIINQFLIIAFVLFSLYIVKDDVKPFAQKVYKYFNLEIKNTFESKGDDFIKNIEQQVVKNKLDGSDWINKLTNPGPLKVVNNITNTNKEVLTMGGIIDFTNRNRLSNGVNIPLTENKQLDSSALVKLNDMFKNQYFEHNSPSGKGAADLAHSEGYKYIIIGENLALGNFSGDQGVVDAWMNSPGHRANILNEHYTEIGVAVGSGVFEGKHVWIAVQHFGLPESSCPSLDKVLSSTISLDQHRINDMITDLNTRKSRIDSGALYGGKTTNEQIKEYNDLISVYNNLVNKLKENIKSYNESVNTFNNCVLKVTQSSH